jgi:hypothetical protein
MNFDENNLDYEGFLERGKSEDQREHRIFYQGTGRHKV